MKSSKNWGKVVGRVYDNVEAALWAAFLAFVIYFVAFTVPKMPEVRAQTERARVQEIAAENALYCEKFGMKVGTEKHKQCLLDLGEFRTKVEKRVYDQSVF
jgi:hypothetical protein